MKLTKNAHPRSTSHDLGWGIDPGWGVDDPGWGVTTTGRP